MNAKDKTTSKPDSNAKISSFENADSQENIEQSLREYQEILANAEEVAKIGSWKWDLRTQKVTWSDQMFNLFGVEREGFDGELDRIIATRIHPDDIDAVTAANRKVREEADPVPMSYRIVLPDGTERTVWAQGKLIRGETGQPIALTGFVQDITERVRAEKKVLQLKRLYATLSQVNQMIVRVQGREELFQTICNVAVKFGEFPVAWVGILDEHSGDVKPVAATGADVKNWPFPIVNLHTGPLSGGLVAQAIRMAKVITSEDGQSDERTRLLQDQFRKHKLRASAVLPFRFRNKVIGALVLISQQHGLFNDSEEIRLLDEMGLDISFALDKMGNESDRQYAEQKIAFQARLLDNINDAVLGLDPQLNITSWNHAAERMYGYSEDEVLGQKVQDIIRLDLSNEQRTSSIKELRETGSSHMEVVQFHRDGHSFWADGRTFALQASNGQVDGYASINRDITERKHVEQTLRENEERLRLSLHAANQGFYDLNVQTGDAVVNREYAQMLGYDPETFVETNAFWIERLHPDDQEVTTKAYADYVSGQRPEYRVEFRQRTKDGKWKWILSLGKIVEYDSNGQPVRMLGTHTDITERKQAEDALKRNEHVLRLFVEHSPASIAMFDRNMNYIVASQRYLVDYRLGQQDLTGRSHYDVFPEIPDRWREIHRRCLQGAVEKADEDPFPREDGTLDWVRWEIRPWYEVEGTIGGVILFSEVITERKQEQDELRLFNAGLEQRVLERTSELSHANRAKDEFLASMSHELRTPLNTVLGLSETLLEQRRGPLNEKQVQSIEMISSSGQHLLGLINDILEISKIEAGKVELHSSLVSVREICESSLSFIRESALNKQIQVNFDNNSSITRLYADPQRLKQILINLLTNAVKFTPEGGRVGLDVYTNAEKDQILFSVTDTGIGIALEDLKKLFTPFTQLDSSLTRQYTGTGLGLALVRKLTELHGGSVNVESEVGRGSRFTVVLPLTQNTGESESNQNVAGSAKPEPAPFPEPSAPKERQIVLLAEDNEINADMVLEYLESRGYQVIVARDGEEVLKKAQATPPDVILMDIQMPKMDGLEATRRLRADPRFESTPIIALTALAMPGDKESSLEAGANEYLSKPVSLKQLAQIIVKLTKPTD